MPVEPAPPPAGGQMGWSAAPTGYSSDAPRSNPNARFHDGFYLRMGIGIGAIGADVESTDGGDPLHIGGLVVPMELAIGGTPSPGVVIGGGLYGFHLPSAKYTYGRGDFVTEEDAEYGSVGMIGPFIDVYLDPEHGIHFQAAPCFTSVVLGQSDEIVTEDVTGSGFGAMVGLGFEGWVGDQWGVGLLARVQYASLEVEDESDGKYDFQMLVPSLLLTATLH